MKQKFRGLLAIIFILYTSFSMQAQQKTITGTVSDDSGPLPGVSIIIKGTTTGAETDFDGKYAIQAKKGDVLVYSFVGMTSQEKIVGDSDVINVVLEAGNVLDEVVVTALGIKRDKKSLGYATSKVDEEALASVTAGETNVTNALRGQVSGVNIISASGDVGSPTSIVIRGASSLAQSNQALFVIDGVPINNESYAQTNNDVRGIDGVNRAADIDMNSVESISVLKGGAATSLYGERGANGVVLITTKKGKNNGKLNIELNQNYAISEIGRIPEFQTKYARGRNGGYNNATHWNWGPAYADNPTFPAGTSLDLNGTGVIEDISGQPIPYYADNYKNFFRTGTNNTVGLAVSNGSEKGNFRMAYTRTDQKGILRNSELKRNNLSLNVNQNITDKFSVGAQINYAKTFTRKAEGWAGGLTYFHHMFDIANRPWKDGQGRRTWFSPVIAEPTWVVNEENEDTNVNRIFGNANMSYRFSDWFTVSYKFGVDTYADNRFRKRPLNAVNSTGNGLGDAYEFNINYFDSTSDFIISGAGQLSEKVGLTYLVGNNIYERKVNRLTTRGLEQILPDFYSLENYKTINTVVQKNNYRLVGLFGDVTFDYNKFLYLGFTARNDWSSSLPVQNNNYFYPSANLGFILSELIENNDFLSYGKLRLSVAQTGKSAPEYQIQDVYVKANGGRNVLGQPSFTVGNTSKNPNLKPEISTEWEIGGEFSLWKNKISIDASYYNKLSVDQYLNIPVSQTTGFTKKVINGGEVRNKGVELFLGLNNLVTFDGFDWGLNFNFSKNTSKIEGLADGFTDRFVVSTFGAQKVAIVGRSAGTIVGTGYKRNDAGEILIDDNGRPKVVGGQIIGDMIPDWLLGISSNFKYKGFGLNVLFDIRQGGDIYNGSESNWVYSGLSKTTENRFYSGSTTANATAVIPGIVESTGQPNTTAIPLDNNYYQTFKSFRNREELVEDGSFVRLRTASLTYDFPSSVLDKIGFSKLQLNVTGQNLWLKTDFRGGDPEASAQGAGNGTGFTAITTPATKSYAFGIRLAF